MIVFTVCSKNFVAYALSLQASLQAHHGSVIFYVALCDDVGDFDTAGLTFQTITLAELGIPQFESMRTRYNITELNTSIKPFVFSLLFDRHPGEMVIYLDPDIMVTSPMIELERAIEQGADCILTPHILEPAEFAEFEDRQFLMYGIYNLGFCALRDTPQVRRIVAWWGRRLETHCTIDLASGIFVDQKWADLLPAFIDKVSILRHPGYNVAYWNLSQRRVQLEKGSWIVNGVPLRFFHFSGNQIEDPTVFSRHSRLFGIENGHLDELLGVYRHNLHQHGHSHYSTLSYAFHWNGAGGENRHTPLSVYETRRKAAGGVPHLPLLRCASKAAFEAARSGMTAVIDERFRIECESIPFDAETYSLPGYCGCCDRPQTFHVSWMYSPRRLPDGRVFPNWREHLDCSGCKLVNRVRASLQTLRQCYDPAPTASIYITERRTRTYDWMAQRYASLQGSEYFGNGYRLGEDVDGVRNEDVQRLSFADGSFDYILSFDVLEHVPDPLAAFAEFFRCLRPGGVLMITAPFSWDSDDHVIRAVKRESGEIEHLLDPEFHGNPLDMERGSFCFRYFGWQILNDLRCVGFVEAEAVSYWSRELRYFGDPQFIMTALKPI
jgi:hypothetical protein